MPALSPPLFQRLDESLPLDRQDWQGRGMQAAVLVALTDETPVQVLLGRRGRNLRLHPGEIAFPGGKREPQDRSPWVTARREALEEVGIEPASVHPLGELAPLRTRSDYEVHPCVARVPQGLQLIVDRREFDSVFYAPLQAFADRERFRLERMRVRESIRWVPHYRFGEDNIWGVTAAILAQLVNLTHDAGLDLKRDWKQNL